MESKIVKVFLMPKFHELTKSKNIIPTLSQIINGETLFSGKSIFYHRHLDTFFFATKRIRLSIDKLERTYRCLPVEYTNVFTFNIGDIDKTDTEIFFDSHYRNLQKNGFYMWLLDSDGFIYGGTSLESGKNRIIEGSNIDTCSLSQVNISWRAKTLPNKIHVSEINEKF